eukprot:761262-Hanusia_phi.AAC.4
MDETTAEEDATGTREPAGPLLEPPLAPGESQLENHPLTRRQQRQRRKRRKRREGGATSQETFFSSLVLPPPQRTTQDDVTLPQDVTDKPSVICLSLQSRPCCLFAASTWSTSLEEEEEELACLALLRQRQEGPRGGGVGVRGLEVWGGSGGL